MRVRVCVCVFVWLIAVLRSTAGCGASQGGSSARRGRESYARRTSRHIGRYASTDGSVHHRHLLMRLCG